MNLNKVFILGRVTADPQLHTTPGGQAVVSLGVASNRTWTGKDSTKQEEVEFHNIVIFGRQAEVASQFLQKGSLLFVEGRLSTRTWNDKDGHERKATEIICENMQLGPKPAGEKGAAKQEPILPVAHGPKEIAPEERIIDLDAEESEDTGRRFTPAFGDEEIKPEEIPF